MDFMIDYGVCMTPLIIGHLVFKPLHSDGVPLSINVTSEIGNSLGYSPRANTLQNKPWTIFSYMLLHADESHVFHNVTGMLVYGRTVFREGGALLVYPMFVFGGAFAALDPLNLKVVQWTAQKQKAVSVDAGRGLGRLADLWNKGAQKVCTWVAPHAIGKQMYIGSSGGVTALFGASTVLATLDLLSVWNDYKQRGNVVFQEPKFFQTVFGVANSIAYMWNEHERLACGIPSGIDHAGHVSGLVFGVVAMCMHQTVKRLVASNNTSNNNRRW